MTKEVDERSDKGVFGRFDHMERIANDRFAKMVYIEECAGNRSVGRPRKGWIDAVKRYLRKRGLDVRQARRMAHDMGVWRGFLRENACGTARGMNP